MYRNRYLALLLVAGWLTGCNNGTPSDPNDGHNNPAPTVPGLRAFQSESDLHTYLMGQVETRASTMRADANVPQGVANENASADSGGGGFAGGGPVAPAAPPTASDAGLAADGASHSGTTIQEAGVDEADVVKTDGQFLYVLSDRNLKIIQVSPLTVVSNTTLAGWGRDLYINGDKVVALTDSDGGFEYGGVATSPPVETFGSEVGVGVSGGSTEPALPPSDVVGVGSSGEGDAVTVVDPANGTIVDPGIAVDFAPIFYRPRTAVAIIDVADRTAPVIEAQYTFDGWQATSRMIDGTLRLVLANYQYYYFDVMPLMGTGEFDTSKVDPAVLVPKYDFVDATGNKTSGDIVKWNSLYRPNDADGFGMMSIITIDVNKSDTFNALGLVAEPGLIYSSTDALYVTNTEWDYLGTQRTTTNVYKFNYTDDNAVAGAVGSVPGRILNQYSMSEHNGYLRVATTVDPIWSADGQITSSNNAVYVLGVTTDGLKEVGKVENIAPGEQIQAARFIGDRGYVVTFEQVDPFFTLDLADPTAPKLVGELKVPGYSTFIVPMDQNHLLTIGQYIPDNTDSTEWKPWGVQLSIFDVTDFANPTLQHNVILGEEAGAYSEALWNPKAFTYFAEQNLVALPISIQENVPQDPWGGLGLPPGVEPGPDGDIHLDVDIDLDENGNPVDFAVNGQSISDIAAQWVPPGFDGVIVYQVSPETGFTEKGRLSTRFDDKQYYYTSFARGVFIGDSVYAVTDGGVRSAPVDEVSTVSSEVYYGPDFSAAPGIGDGGIWFDGGAGGIPTPGIEVR